MNTQTSPYLSPFKSVLPVVSGEPLNWGRLYGSGQGLVLGNLAIDSDFPLLVISPDMMSAYRLEQEIRFYTKGSESIRIIHFPDWETLPYDLFSPHQDIISQRLSTLSQLPQIDKGIIIVPATTLMHRIVPRTYIEGHSLLFSNGDFVDIEALRTRLLNTGYSCVSQVMEHGEFAVRGSLIDIFPMGSKHPFRIDLFDNEIESIRIFDEESQRTVSNIEKINILPARETPLTEEAIHRFRKKFRQKFEGNPGESHIYRDVSQSIAPNGIEYYLPLFFDETNLLFDYLPHNCVVVCAGDVQRATEDFWEDINNRYESGRHDTQRPLLPPDELFAAPGNLLEKIASYPRVNLQKFEIESGNKICNFATSSPPWLNLTINARHTHPFTIFEEFAANFQGRILLVAETTGRREMLLEMLADSSLTPALFESFQTFLHSDVGLGITVAPLDEGLLIEEPKVAILGEAQLFGEHAMQRRRRKPKRDTDTIIRNLTELEIGSPVVHEDHGVGRYLGLKKMDIGNVDTEYLMLEYAGGDLLYVPVSSLHLISRYTGVSPENAPLHKLGTDHWQKAKRKASEKARDVAVELLDIYARREARKGYSIETPGDDYMAFTASFPFEETPDQEQAILDVISDMKTDKPMDRLVCGDVGFGKTEVAMRASFLATSNGYQVAILVPTTLLAQQHYQNFKDRFADWPVNIEMLSRFVGKKKQTEIIERIGNGQVDIIIGTHKLLQDDVKFRNLGMVILDEEHRFGVRQKERLKALRSEVDVLTLTATPIPRTLNLALSQIRELSIISTPPTSRVAIKTFVNQWEDRLIIEACMREIKRGGQVYFLHNEVKTIDNMADRLRELVPEASIQIAHGQMSERELEQVMLDFYHQRFNILICTTIIETGIDVPTANTIVINRADKFGLAQLYQLRGRVGRSHHRAYAYLIIPHPASITADATKRLEAIESLEELGTGFMLATHDLEIRGAGEFLGEEQSGQMQEIGFTLYTELLERAVSALKSGALPELDRPIEHGSEVDLHVPCLIPEDYMPDVHNRLIMYKRIANAESRSELKELQVEMIDRFGLLPEQVKLLFRITELKLKATMLGVRKLEAGPKGGRIIFGSNPNVNSENLIHMIQSQPDVFKFDGKDKFRFIMELDERDNRFKQIDMLLDKLFLDKAA